MLTKKLELKHQCYSDAYIVVKGDISVDKKKHFTADDFEAPNNTAAMQLLLILQIIMRLVRKSWFLKTMLHLSIAF